jgi:hypothetical protein
MPPLILPRYAISDQAAMMKPEPQYITKPSALKLTTSYTDPSAELRNRRTGTDPTTLALLSQVLHNSRESRASVNLEHKKQDKDSKIAATNKEQLASATSSPESPMALDIFGILNQS